MLHRIQKKRHDWGIQVYTLDKIKKGNLYIISKE